MTTQQATRELMIAKTKGAVQIAIAQGRTTKQ